MELKQVFPIFEEGRILKRDALDLLREYAPEFASLLIEEHGSGVMAGFRIREQAGTVFVGPGILKDRDSFSVCAGWPRFRLTSTAVRCGSY